MRNGTAQICWERSFPICCDRFMLYLFRDRICLFSLGSSGRVAVRIWDNCLRNYGQLGHKSIIFFNKTAPVFNIQKVLNVYLFHRLSAGGVAIMCHYCQVHEAADIWRNEDFCCNNFPHFADRLIVLNLGLELSCSSCFHPVVSQITQRAVYFFISFSSWLRSLTLCRIYKLLF